MPYGVPMSGDATGGQGVNWSSLLAPGFLSFLPAILGKLGVFGEDPQMKLRRQIQGLLAPQNMSQQTQQFYQQNLGSPAYSQAQGSIAAGANQTANQVAQHLGRMGIGSTGTGAILGSLTPSLVGQQQAQLRTGAFQGAQQQAQQNIQQQIQNLLGTSGPSQNMQLFGGGLAALAPFLQSFFSNKYPGAFGNIGQFGQQGVRQ